MLFEIMTMVFGVHDLILYNIYFVLPIKKKKIIAQYGGESLYLQGTGWDSWAHM